MLQGIIEFHTTFRESFWVTMAFGWVSLSASSPLTLSTDDICKQSLLIICGLIVSSPISRSPRLWKLVGLSIFVSFVVVNVILLTQAPEIRSVSLDLSSPPLTHRCDTTGLLRRCLEIIRTIRELTLELTSISSVSPPHPYHFSSLKMSLRDFSDVSRKWERVLRAYR